MIGAARHEAKLVKKDGDFLLDFGDRKLERLQFQGSTLRVQHFDPADRYPDNPTTTGLGQKSELSYLSPEAGLDNGEYSSFRGKWTVTFTNKVVRIYLINSTGDFRILDARTVLHGRLMKKGGHVLLDGNPNEIERLSLSNGKLYVEMYVPASSYPQKVDLAGYGERAK
jgi:hypothetical protein